MAQVIGSKFKELYPYVVLLPTSIEEKIEYIMSLFSSPVTVEILRLFEWDKELCQKEIIVSLSQHSNKTVISSIRKLVSLNLLEVKDKVEIRGNRRVRVKCYKLTDIGKWYNILFKDINELDSKLLREALTNLSVMFMAKILPFSNYLRVSFMDFINQVLSNAMESAAKSRRHLEYDLLVFGSIALDVYLKPDVRMFSGGAGANVASLASNLGLKTGFISKVPANIIGSYLLAELINEGVDVSLSIMDQGVELPICIVFEPLEPTQLKCTCKPQMDLRSLPVIDRVNEEIIQACNNSRSIYLGEGVSKVYLELLSKINRENKIIVFRPHKLVLEHYFDEFTSILHYSPILILNEEKEQIMRRKGLEVPSDLFKIGVRELIVTRGSKGATLYVEKREPKTFKAPGVNAMNTVGAGDAFSASLIYYLLKNETIEESVRKAVYLSALSTTQLSSRKHLAELSKTIST
jgi:sugar/nucleoside kinase (ribokinase family)